MVTRGALRKLTVEVTEEHIEKGLAESRAAVELGDFFGHTVGHCCALHHALRPLLPPGLKFRVGPFTLYFGDRFDKNLPLPPEAVAFVRSFDRDIEELPGLPPEPTTLFVYVPEGITS